MRRAASILAVLASITLGCHSEAPVVPSLPAVSGSLPVASESGDSGATLLPPNAEADDLLYYCAAIPFPLRALAKPGGDELVNHPAALALRDLLASATDDFLPRQGWIFIGESLAIAEFFARRPAAGDPFGGYYANFDKAGLQYKFRSYGGCRPRLQAPPGKMSLEWSLAEPLPPGPEATSLAVEALPPESFCGPPPGTIEMLNVGANEASVTVVLVARQPDGGLRCPGPGCGPITPSLFQISLPEPLGDRRLFDGSTYPGRSVTEPWARGCGG